jgi:hypothetical protein
MNISIEQLKANKGAFMKTVYLTFAMEKYEKTLNEADKLEVEMYARISNGMPLPSGRWGNSIALALETNHYICAEYLINNSQKSNLETLTVVSDLGGKESLSLRDEYLFSLLTFDLEEVTERIKDLSNRFPEDRDKYMAYLKETKKAIQSIEKKLNITQEDKILINYNQK